MKLPRLQLHLSTLLIISLLAAGLVWLNVRARYYPVTTLLEFRGWPNPYQSEWYDQPESFDWQWSNLWFNVAFCVTVLVVATFAIEWVTHKARAVKRFHLSTLLLLTVLAGAFIGAQLLPRRTAVSSTLPDERNSVAVVPARTHGWPISYELDLGYRRDSAPGYIVVNICIGFAGLALVGYVSEKIARRRTPK